MHDRTEQSDGIYISVISKNVILPCRTCHKMLPFPIIGILHHITLNTVSHSKRTGNISRDRHIALFQFMQMFLRQKLPVLQLITVSYKVRTVVTVAIKDDAGEIISY
jgi:hypothetical protein